MTSARRDQPKAERKHRDLWKKFTIVMACRTQLTVMDQGEVIVIKANSSSGK